MRNLIIEDSVPVFVSIEFESEFSILISYILVDIIYGDLFSAAKFYDISPNIVDFDESWILTHVVCLSSLFNGYDS